MDFLQISIVKPPIIYADVRFQEAMTTKETTYAQSLTTKPVKGMFTGPVTILNWSFVRQDISFTDIVLSASISTSL